jgi:hypothetical protein
MMNNYRLNSIYRTGRAARGFASRAHALQQQKLERQQQELKRQQEEWKRQRQEEQERQQHEIGIEDWERD